ncbi:MAG TPA: hypothetical protein HPP77_07795 [Candidatus Hydrogenedentes bacterium]|nr:hypothetical protein [Candidatus Hydrogenedentota bacterium]
MRTQRAFILLVGLSAFAGLLTGGCRRGFEQCVGPYGIEILSNVTINGTDTGGIPGGIDLDPQDMQFDRQICEMPSLTDINGYIESAVGSTVASHIEITQVNLDEVTLTAQSGTWDFIQSIDVDFIPKPVNGVAQDPIDLGGATAPTGGFGTELLITPASGVNFLELMNENDANPATGCPSIRVSLVGTMPTVDITFDVEISVEACARITLR